MYYQYILYSFSSTFMPKPKSQKIVEEQKEEEFEEQQEMSSEDEDAALLTNKVEQKLLQTLAKIKMKDPSIYQTKQPIYQDGDFIQEEQSQEKAAPQTKTTYKDMLIQGENDQQQEENLPPVQEEKNAKAKFKKVLQKNIEKIQNDEDDLFKVKQKIKANKQEKAQPKTQKEMFKELTKNFDLSSKKLIKKVWNSDEMDQTDLFLKNYILSKKWLSSKFKQGQNPQQKKIDQQDQERSVQMDQYEQQYNFRFEQPGGTTITQYPRQVANSLRQKPQTRKQKRKKLQEKKKQQEQKLRKQAQQRKQQLKKNILERLVPQNQEEQEQDHDYFFCDDCCKGLEEGQIVWQCIVCEDYMLCCECNQLIIHKHKLEKGSIPKGFGAPSDSESALKHLKSCKICRKRITPTKKCYEYTDRSYIVNSMCETCYDEANLQIKKKYKSVQAENPNYEELLQNDPQKIKELTDQKDIEQMVDQYLKYDFEDVISGGLKTKFKYINVPAESFGLSDQQILFGDDKQLNKYVSIKKLVPYMEQSIRLRNSYFNKKIKSIKKSVKQTKNLLEKGFAKLARLRYINKRKNRNSAIKKRLEKRLRIVNLSNKQVERDHFVSNSRLQSYGIKSQQNK